MSLIKELLKITPASQETPDVGQVDDLISPKPVKPLAPTDPLIEAKRAKSADLPEQLPYVDPELNDSAELKSLAKRHPEAVQAMINWN